jgi:drug/metabolite transporter (DMT)-like permease
MYGYNNDRGALLQNWSYVMSTFLFAVLCVVFSVAAQFLLKAGVSGAVVKSVLAQPLGIGSVFAIFSNLYILAGFALYGLGAVAWLGVLSQWDVSKAYPIVGLGFVFTVAVGWFIGEQVTLIRALGVVLICVGVVLVARS